LFHYKFNKIGHWIPIGLVKGDLSVQCAPQVQ